MLDTVKSALKPLTLLALGSDALLDRKLASINRQDKLTVLNLHQVSERPGSATGALSPSIFSDLLAWLKERFDIVTFADLPDSGRTGRPKLVLSFDDGYEDFIEVAAPILENHGIRASQNIIPECVETGNPPMNVVLQDFIRTAPARLLQEIEVPWLEGGFNSDDRVTTGIRASRVFKSRPQAEQVVLFDTLLPSIARYEAFRPTRMMNGNEVREIAAIHEVGAHSYSHASMAVESDAYLIEDLTRCRTYFRERLQLPVQTYAFPNGSFRDQQIAIVRQSGFDHILLVGEDFSRTTAHVHKRFTVFGSTLAELRFRATGGFRRAAE